LPKSPKLECASENLLADRRLSIGASKQTNPIDRGQVTFARPIRYQRHFSARWKRVACAIQVFADQQIDAERWPDDVRLARVDRR
jgi:hypothetical protein